MQYELKSKRKQNIAVQFINVVETDRNMLNNLTAILILI